MKWWKENQKAITGLWSEISRTKGIFIFSTVLMSCGLVAALLQPRIIGWVVDEGLVKKDISQIYRLGFFFLLAEIIRISCVIGSTYCFDMVGQKVMHRIRARLLDTIISSRMDIFSTNTVGRLTTRMMNDVSALSELFSSGMVAIAQNVLLMSGMLVSLFLLNSKLAFICAILFGVFLFLARIFSAQLQRGYQESRKKLSELNSFLAEVISGIKVVQIFNKENKQLEKFNSINSEYYKNQEATVKTFALFQPSITLISGLSVALIIYVGGLDVQNLAFSIGDWTAFITLLMGLFQPVREVTDKWNVLLSGMTAAERVFSTFDFPLEVTSGLSTLQSEKEQSVSDNVPLIEFKNVCFRYQSSGPWIVNQLSFRLFTGKKVAIIGPTGAGKSTILSLIMRFYEPQFGEILYKGKKIQEYPLDEYRKFFGYIQQDVFIFSGTIEENLFSSEEGGGNAYLLDENKETFEFQKEQSKVNRKFRDKLNADLMNQLDISPQIELQERGTNLSAGERQSIAFYRALSRNAEIFLLDEATSHMDVETEKNFDRYLKGKTLLIIAHRLSTVQDADEVIQVGKTDTDQSKLYF